jgi:transposase
VLSIEQIEDRERLRSIALVLEKENRSLRQKIQELERKLAHLSGLEIGAEMQLELTYLRELLVSRERALFGESSEKRLRPEAQPAAVENPKKKQTGHGPREQPQLPQVDCEHELGESERTCSQCGSPLSEMAGQSEDSEEITVVERRFVLVHHRRKKYRCSCNGEVKTAPAPLKLTVGKESRSRRYSIDFAVEVAVNKYLDHLPLERQVQMMKREGLIIDSQTLWDQLEGLARVLGPTAEANRQRVLASPVVGADETWWRLMAGKPPEKGSKRWWAWALASPEAVAYQILDSRSKSAAKEVLSGYQGTLITDGYGVYAGVAKDAPELRLAHCWAHVRRKFVEADAITPGAGREALDWIGQLYKVERDAKESLEERRKLRQDRSRPIVDRLQALALEHRGLPESKITKAFRYMLGLWPGLIHFLDDSQVPLDNNATERALRGTVVGRKNHYGSRSKRGTEVTALFYSLLGTAKLAGCDPRRYLLEATRAALLNQAPVLPPAPPPTDEASET